MHALIICSNIQLAELLTVALRQVGLRGVVRKSLPSDADLFASASLALIDAAALPQPGKDLRALRTMANSPIILFVSAVDIETMLDLYGAGATVILQHPLDLRLVAAQALALTRVVMLPESMNRPHPLLDTETQRIYLPHGSFRLTTLEFRLLATLLSRPGSVFSPERLVTHVWGYTGDGDRSLVKSLVNRTRRKIEPEPQSPIYLVTEPGVGYRFEPPEMPVGSEEPTF